MRIKQNKNSVCDHNVKGNVSRNLRLAHQFCCSESLPAGSGFPTLAESEVPSQCVSAFCHPAPASPKGCSSEQGAWQQRALLWLGLIGKLHATWEAMLWPLPGPASTGESCANRRGLPARILRWRGRKCILTALKRKS